MAIKGQTNLPYASRFNGCRVLTEDKRKNKKKNKQQNTAITKQLASKYTLHCATLFG